MIEEAQTAFRESIETSKKPADESARLVEKYRARIGKAKPPNPALQTLAVRRLDRNQD